MAQERNDAADLSHDTNEKYLTDDSLISNYICSITCPTEPSNPTPSESVRAMETETNPQSIPDGAPFEVFFNEPPSEVISATYALDQLLKKDNHSDVFSLRYLPSDGPDPNPTGGMLEARRFIIDGSDGLPSGALQYRFRSAKRLANRQLRTSIPENDHAVYVVYRTDQKPQGPENSPSSPVRKCQGSSGAPIELEESQKVKTRDLELHMKTREEYNCRWREYRQQLIASQSPYEAPDSLHIRLEPHIEAHNFQYIKPSFFILVNT